MLKCKEVSHIVAEELPLNFWGRFQLKMHLLMCVHCRRYVAQIRDLGRGARQEFDLLPEADQTERMEHNISERLCPPDQHSP